MNGYYNSTIFPEIMTPMGPFQGSEREYIRFRRPNALPGYSLPATSPTTIYLYHQRPYQIHLDAPDRDLQFSARYLSLALKGVICAKFGLPHRVCQVLRRACHPGRHALRLLRE